MKNKKDGGPAFPVECEWHHLDGDVELRGIRTGNNSGWEAGMSLRDWFAGQALALGGEFFHNLGNGCYTVETVTVAAYEVADALLAARAQKKEAK